MTWHEISEAIISQLTQQDLGKVEGSVFDVVRTSTTMVFSHVVIFYNRIFYLIGAIAWKITVTIRLLIPFLYLAGYHTLSPISRRCLPMITCLQKLLLLCPEGLWLWLDVP